MNKSSVRRPRCLVVYPHLPHYRFGVFSELDADARWVFTFAADIDSSDGSIRTIPFDRLQRTVHLENHWLRGVLWQKGLLAAIRDDYDAVVFLGDATHASTWIGALFARARGSRVLYWTIGWHRPERGLKRLVRASFYRLAHRVMLYGSDGRAIGASVGFPLRRMVVIGNSGDSSAADADGNRTEGTAEVERLGDPDLGDRDWVGAVVRLTREKRLELLVGAVANLRKRGRDVGVLLVGSGPESERIKRLATDRGVPVRMPGAVHTREGLAEVYKRLVVTVLPERAGLTVVQSMSHGVPVVSVGDPFRQVPEFRAIVSGVTGDLYAPEDELGLADAVERVLDMVAADPEGVAASCRDEVARRWSAKAHAGAIRAVLDAVAGGV